MMTQKLTIYGPNIADHGPTIQVHKCGCRDGNQPKYRTAERLDYEAPDRMAVVRLFYEDMANENGEPIESYADQVHFAPCVTLK